MDRNCPSITRKVEQQSFRSHNDVKNRFYADIKKSLRKFNRWQKHYKIKSTKPIKVEGLTKIFSLGFKNYPEEDQYKHLSKECLSNSYLKKGSSMNCFSFMTITHMRRISKRKWSNSINLLPI